MASRSFLVPVCIAAGFILLAGGMNATVARTHKEPSSRAPLAGALEDSESRPLQGRSIAADTLAFGFLDEDGFAILNETWTWDHGGADPLEGWYATDVSTQTEAFFRQITAATWSSGTGNTVDAPVLNGQGSAWVGKFENEADSLCWDAGLGYGNSWNQRLSSPPLSYSGSGEVTLEFTYFSDSEEDFDYTRVLLRRLPSGTEVDLNGNGFSGEAGLGVPHPANPPVGASFLTTLDATDFGGETSFEIVFEFTSDGGWSDQDGQFTTEYGAFGVDDVSLSGSLAAGDAVFSFETGLDGWSPLPGPAIGSWMSVHDISAYVIEDACDCDLSGKVLAFHDDSFEHPDGQHVYARSNPVDVLNDVTPVLSGSGNALAIEGWWDQYSDMPRANGVFYRPGWDYYPFECPVTGAIRWSGRVGQDNAFYVGNDPICALNANFGTSNGVPTSGVEQIRFIFEIYASCDAFGIPPEVCTNVTNFTPVIDNVQVRFSRAPIAPRIAFASGTRYHDGFSQGQFLDPDDPGRADVAANTNFGESAPFIRGDSLYVAGPSVTSSTRWEARLWFRIAREGPGVKPLPYEPWKAAVADGRNITGGEFTFAWMDSFQLGTQTGRNKFVSHFRETGEDDYNPGGGELSDANEIIRDDILVPGTQIEYFVTANYTATPGQNFTIPDTTGQFFNDFKILPMWEEFEGTLRFPCTLFIDAYNSEGTQATVGAALTNLGIPFDRYDYLDPSACWQAPFGRGIAPSNNGPTLAQLLGYRAIIVTTGIFSSRVMWPHDWGFFSDWLTAVACDGNLARQGLIVNGDSPATMLEYSGSSVLATLGVVPLANAYNQYGSDPDENFCVRLEAPLAGGEKYGTSNSQGDYEYDAWGNGCPNRFSFDVLDTWGTGVGNRSFVNVNTLAETRYAQVVNQVDSPAGGNFRSVMDGVAYAHLSARDATLECVPDAAHVVNAVTNELRAGLEWIFDGAIPTFREEPCQNVIEVPSTDGSSPVSRLFPNAPNPFNPRTMLRFSLARTADAELTIFDATGRRVRTLVDATLEAGNHEVIWDGTDASGRSVVAGVYWSQFRTEDYLSSKKMLVIR